MCYVQAFPKQYQSILEEFDMRPSFQFKTRNGEILPCLPMLAQLLTNRAKGCRELQLQTDDPHNWFRDFLQGIDAHRFIAHERIDFFITIFTELENLAIKEQLTKYKSDDNKELYESLNLLMTEEGLDQHADKIEKVAHNFYQLPRYYLRMLPIRVLSELLAHRFVWIRSDDHLVDLLDELTRENAEYFKLAEHIDFECVSPQSMEKFCALTSYCGAIPIPVFKRLERRLLSASPVKKFNRSVSFDAEMNENPLDGITNCLTHKCGRNPADAGIMTASLWPERSQADGIYPAKRALNLHTLDIMATANSNSSYLMYDFKNGKVTITGYTLKIRHSTDKWLPQTWVIEVSNDNNSWVIIDQQHKQTCVKPCAVLHYPVKNIIPNVRYVRMRTTGPDTSGTYFLIVAGFEVFGHFEG